MPIYYEATDSSEQYYSEESVAFLRVALPHPDMLLMVIWLATYYGTGTVYLLAKDHANHLM